MSSATLLLLIASLGTTDSAPGANRLIGDEALWAHFEGPAPTTLSVDDSTEIHLRYVLAALRNRKPVQTPEQRAARQRNLDRLEAYIDARRFPQNDDHPDRFRPTFVDDRGHVCAVGHLFAADRGLAAAHRVAASHKYAFVPEIDDAELLAWAGSSGLTLEELSLIQPAYDDRPEVSRPMTLPMATLDRADEQTHLTTSTGIEIGGADGVTIAHDFYLQGLPYVDEGNVGVGGYVAAGFASPWGYPQSAAVAASNVELGGLFVVDGLHFGRLVFRSGALIPSAPSSVETAEVNARAVTGRLTDLAQRLPAAAGARASVSPIFFVPCNWMEAIGSPAYCVVRVDGGLDVFSTDSSNALAVPRLNVAVGAQFPLGGFFIENATVYYDSPLGDGRFYSTVAATLRYRMERGWGMRDVSWFEAGVSAVVPVTNQPAGWAFTIDLRATIGPTTATEL